MIVWLLPTGMQQSTIDSGTCAAFSHDSHLLAVVVKDVVRLWDLLTNAYRPNLSGHSGWVERLMFSPDDQLLASGSYNAVQLWSVETGDCQCTLENIGSMAFSPDSKLLALGSPDGPVRVRNMAKKEEDVVFRGHAGPVEAVYFSPDGRLLASLSTDATVRIWDVQASVNGFYPSAGVESQDKLGWISAVSCSPNKRLVVVYSNPDEEISVWKATTGDLCYRLKGGHPSFSVDSQLLLSGSKDGTVRLLNVQSWNDRSFIKGCSYMPVFSPDGQLMASTSRIDCSIHIWDSQTGDDHFVFYGHSELIHDLVFSPTDQLLGSASYDCTIQLWDLETGECSHFFTMVGHPVAFAPNGSFLALSSYNSDQLRLLNPHAGTCHFNLCFPIADFGNLGYFRDTCTITFSPNSDFMAATTLPGRMVWLWDTRIGEQLLSLSCSSFKPRIEFGARSDVVFVDGIAHQIPSAHLSDAEIAELSRSVSDLQLRSSGQWVTKSSEWILWIPTEHRGSTYTIHGNQVIVGSGSGCVTFLWFDDNPESSESGNEKIPFSKNAI